LSIAMTLRSTLVLVTAAISYRRGSIVGLIFFVFSLMIGAAAVSHLALPQAVAMDYIRRRQSAFRWNAHAASKDRP
jgi:hypothetical protein